MNDLAMVDIGKTLFQIIDELSEYYIQVWEDVCNIESPTQYKPGVDAVGNYFIKLAKKRGWKTEVFEQPVSGNVVCITMNADVKERPIAFSGHIDTVQPVGLYGNPPVKKDAEKIYGPGVVDCKGGVVGSFMAMDALNQIGYRKRPVMLLLQSDEEVGSRLSNKETIRYICEKAKDAVAFLNTEEYIPDKACITRKGIIRYKFTIFGIAVHSSACAKIGASAIAEAAHKILRLEKLKDNDGLTCNCGLIYGGTVANTVPAKCSFWADIRFSTYEELEQVKKLVQEIADEIVIPGCSCTVEQESYRTAMVYSERNKELLNRMNDIFAESGLPILSELNELSGSDAADVSEYGIPCLDSLGVDGGGIHSTHEYAFLDSLARCAKRLAVTAYYI